jgi:hypothetical protein
LPPTGSNELKEGKRSGAGLGSFVIPLVVVFFGLCLFFHSEQAHAVCRSLGRRPVCHCTFANG